MFEVEAVPVTFAHSAVIGDSFTLVHVMLTLIANSALFVGIVCCVGTNFGRRFVSVVVFIFIVKYSCFVEKFD